MEPEAQSGEAKRSILTSAADERARNAHRRMALGDKL
jgi:hypothetical protein